MYACACRIGPLGMSALSRMVAGAQSSVITAARGEESGGGRPSPGAPLLSMSRRSMPHASITPGCICPCQPRLLSSAAAAVVRMARCAALRRRRFGTQRGTVGHTDTRTTTQPGRARETQETKRTTRGRAEATNQSVRCGLKANRLTQPRTNQRSSRAHS